MLTPLIRRSPFALEDIYSRMSCSWRTLLHFTYSLAENWKNMLLMRLAASASRVELRYSFQWKIIVRSSLSLFLSFSYVSQFLVLFFPFLPNEQVACVCSLALTALHMRKSTQGRFKTTIPFFVPCIVL